MSSSHSNTTTWFLADHTNGHAIGTVVLSSSVTLYIVAKRYVLEQKLLLTAYSDLDFCLEVVSRSR